MDQLVNYSGLLLIVSGVAGFISSKLIVNRLRYLAEIFSFILLIIFLLLRWNEYIRKMDVNLFLSFPVSSFYEVSVFFVIVSLSIIVFFKKRIPDDGLFSVITDFILGSVLLLLNLFGFSSESKLFLPSLKSYWLIAHVVLSFIAYSMFFTASVLSLMSLIKKNIQKERVGLILKIITKGLIVFFIGAIVFGAIWAEYSWGRFWAWDPKETWAFITLCVYSLLIHFELNNKLNPRLFYSLTIFSFLFVLFTFFGVNLIFDGLHSYINP